MMKSVYADEKNCSGCGACLNACPSGAIAMIANGRGIPYPVIDHEKCTDSSCRNCVAVCPMIGEKPLRPESESVLANSYSGNVFAAISGAMIRMGGVVFSTELAYPSEVKSATYAIYEEAIRALREGRSVLFTGTPCETAGMRGLMKRKVYPQKLYTCDIACPERGAAMRPSCGVCPFSDGNRASDITIADRNGIRMRMPELGDAGDVSLVLVNSAKGQTLLELAKDDLILYRHPAEKLSA